MKKNHINIKQQPMSDESKKELAEMLANMFSDAMKKIGVKS